MHVFLEFTPTKKMAMPGLFSSLLLLSDPNYRCDDTGRSLALTLAITNYPFRFYADTASPGLPEGDSA